MGKSQFDELRGLRKIAVIYAIYIYIYTHIHTQITVFYGINGGVGSWDGHEKGNRAIAERKIEEEEEKHTTFWFSLCPFLSVSVKFPEGLKFFFGFRLSRWDTTDAGIRHELLLTAWL